MSKKLLLLLYPSFLFGQAFNPSITEIEIRTNTNFIENTSSHPLTQQYILTHLSKIFNQGRFSLFLKEAVPVIQNTPIPELIWMKGSAELQLKQYKSALNTMLSLTNSLNIEIKHRALYDAAQIYYETKHISNAVRLLQTITKDNIPSSIEEAALAKLFLFSLEEDKRNLAQFFITELKDKYPKSLYLNELHYLFAQYELRKKNINQAEKYALEVLTDNSNFYLQRLLAEITLHKKEYSHALQQFLVLAQTNNPFQDEALYKAGLIYKLQSRYIEAESLFKQLIEYYPRSSYIDRTKSELAAIHTLLKKYDEALSYYRYESGFSGNRKADALLKIVEIYYLRGNAGASRRTAIQIQKSFPYSTYANEAIYWVARTYMLENRFKKSIQLFNNYLMREPLSPKKDEITLFLGQAYLNLGEQNTARTYFQNITQHSTNQTLIRDALLGLGRTYILEPVRSLEFYDKIIKQYIHIPGSDQALYLAGATRYNIRQNQNAIENFSMLTNIYSQSVFYPDAVLALTKLQFKANNFTDILSLETVPDTKNTELLSELKMLQAQSFAQIGEYEKALPLFSESSVLTKDKEAKEKIFLAEAATLRNLNRHQEAASRYEKYLASLKKKDKTNDIEELLWSEIAASYIEAENLEKAQLYSKKISEKDPYSPYLADLYFRLGDKYFTQQHYPKAAEVYQKVRQLSKNKDTQAEAHLREGYSLIKFSPVSAREVFQDFITQYPKHIAVPGIYLELSQTDPDYLEKILETAPRSPEAEKARIRIADSLKNSTIEDLTTKIMQTKDIGLKSRLGFHLGSLLEKNNQTTDALKIYRQIHKHQDSEFGAESALKAAQILLDKENVEEAIKFYIQIISQYNDEYTPQALLGIIKAYEKLVEPNNVERFKERLLKQYPDSKEAKSLSV